MAVLVSVLSPKSAHGKHRPDVMCENLRVLSWIETSNVQVTPIVEILKQLLSC